MLKIKPAVVLYCSLFFIFKTIPTIPNIQPAIAIINPHGIDKINCLY